MKMKDVAMSWLEQAADQSSELVFQSPARVIHAEALVVAKFADEYWGDRTGKNGAVIPGLNSVADPTRDLRQGIGQEIRALEQAAQRAHADYRYAEGPTCRNDDMDRARFLINEIDSVLEWYLEDGVQDDKDADFARLRAEHAKTPATIDALAAELADYATVAERYRKEISGLGAFDPACIDEASVLAATLRIRVQSGPRVSAEASDALSNRNRILNLLYKKMQVVRAAARFVFRHHPDIVRQVTSSYERRKRAATREKQAVSASAPVPSIPALGGAAV